METSRCLAAQLSASRGVSEMKEALESTVGKETAPADSETREAETCGRGCANVYRRNNKRGGGVRAKRGPRGEETAKQAKGEAARNLGYQPWESKAASLVSCDASLQARSPRAGGAEAWTSCLVTKLGCFWIYGADAPWIQASV